MAEMDSSDDPPPFEDAFRGDDVEQRIYGTIFQTREPTTASAIADRVDCDPKTARKYLDWFTELRIATRHDGDPVTYERNDAYFQWRQINQLAAEHSFDTLGQRVRDLTKQITAYEETYDAETPSAVDAVEAAESSDERTIDGVYSDLTDWVTTREERKRYERARQRCADTERTLR